MGRRLRDRVDWPLASVGVALVIVAVLYGVQILHTGADRARLDALQHQVAVLQRQVATLTADLAADDARLAAIHRQARRLAHGHHANQRLIRRLERESAPRPTLTPQPAPTVTVTRTARPTPRPTRTVTARPTCTTAQVRGMCVTPPALRTFLH